MAEDLIAPATPKPRRRRQAPAPTTPEAQTTRADAPARSAPEPAPRGTRPRAKTEEATPQAPAPRSVRAARMGNQIGPAPERARGGRNAQTRASPEMNEPGGPTHRAGDVPASLTRRYFTEALRGGATVAFYEGPGAKTVAFHDHGTRLACDRTHPAVVRDMAAIAAHRRWTTIEVKGADEFRREVWLEARALGLDVKGYKPRERDQQELDRRLQAPAGRDRPPARARRTAPTADRADEGLKTPRPAHRRPDFDAGVAGALIATGEAPYRRRAGEPVTPFIRLDRGDGRTLDIWGVGLPDALKRSGAQIGDAVQVRRDGVDVLHRTVELRAPETGVATPPVRDVNRNRWVIEADRFRRASPADAARDTRLQGAQSHLAVLNTVIDRSVKDPEVRARLRAQARDIVADELAQGRRFTPARIRDVEPALAQNLAQAPTRHAPERAHRR